MNRTGLLLKPTRRSGRRAPDVGTTVPARRFQTTRRTVIFAAGKGSPEAFAAFCRGYWGPVYWFIRALGIPEQDAADVTQGFFASLAQPRDLAQWDPARGRFRNWLRTAAKFHLFNHLDHLGRVVAGGRFVHLSIDSGPGRDGARHLASADPIADQLFDRCWAVAVIDEAIARTRAQYEAEHRLDVFECLRGLLGGSASDPGEASPDLGLVRPNKSSGALRVDRHRLANEMKGHYRKHLRAVVGESVVARELIDDEIRALIASLD